MFDRKLVECGFMMMNTIFLTLVVSFTALIFLNGAARVKESDSALRSAAQNLANEQFAEIEHLAAEGNLSTGNFNFLGAPDDLKNYGLHTDADLINKKPAEFFVTATVQNFSGYDNLRNVTVKVKCTSGNKVFEIELEKVVRVQLPK